MAQAVDQDVQTEETNLDETQAKEPETETEEKPETESESEEVAEEAADKPEDEAEEKPEAEEEGEQASDEDEEGIEVRIGDAAPASAETEPKGVELVRALREQNRKLAKEVRQLKATSQPTQQQQSEQRPFVGPEPTPDDEDVNWDPKKLAEKVRKHELAKIARDNFDAKEKAAKDARQKKLEAVQADYFKKRDDLAKVAPDVEEAEEFCRESFTVEQQDLIVSACNDAPRVALALKRNPQEAKRLAAIKDLPKFTAALGVLESKIKVSSRKPSTSPAPAVKGGGGTNSLKALEAAAHKSGDFTKLFEAEDRAEKARKK